MRNTKAKEIRKIIPIEDATSKRVYRRIKRLYSRLPHDQKNGFLEGLKSMFQH
jgi:hypothetical protein